jgi:hypothetical protein
MSDSVKKWHEMQEEEKYKNDKKMANKKIITDELIEKILKDKGISMYEQVDNSLQKIKEHYNVEIVDNWNGTPDYSIYAESTADGYEVWVATTGDGRNICINEDVYYYESDLGDVLYQAITDGYNEQIYVDDIDSQYVEDGIMQAWEDYINDKIAEIEDELIEEGYKREDTEDKDEH